MTWNETLITLDENMTNVLDGTDVDPAALTHLALATISVHDLVDWLRDHGASHLSTMERIELAERLITRRRFITAAGGLLGAAALGACSAGEQAAAPTTTVAATRTVATPRGSVTIPANPQRIVALHTHDLANALALDLPVIAGSGENGQPNAPFPPYLVAAFGEQLTGVTALAYQPKPNFEQLTALQPDVIFSGIFGNLDIGYDTFEAIAPMVTYVYSEGAEFTVVPWREVLRVNGTQFGREDAAEAWITRFEQSAADLRVRLVSEWRGATYAIVDPYSEQFWTYGATGGHTARTLTEELGIELADSVNTLLAEASQRSQGGGALSYELLGAIDADIIFIPVSAGADGTPNRSGLEALTAQPLWATLPAVRAGQVYEFIGDIWRESGPTALAFLDVVEQALLG